MHETRVLALGGQPPHLPVGPHQTDRYLRQTMLWALTAAVLLSFGLAAVLRHRQSTPARSIPRGSSPPRIVNALPPPSLVRSPGGMVQPHVRVDRGRTIPVPDAEVTASEVDPFADVSRGTGVFDQPGSGDAQTADIGSLGDWAPPQPQAATVFLFAETPPELVSMTIPAYPELAREAGVEGIVHVEVLVGEDGLVEDAVIEQGLPLLDEAALEAALTAVFKPAQQSGRPVRTLVVLPIEFSLRR